MYMYLSHWHLKSKPFENTPDPGFFYFSPEHEEAYIRFKYGIAENKGAMLLTGNYGCGKTTLIRLLVSELDPDHNQVAILTHLHGGVEDLLTAILMEFGEEVMTGNTNALERKIGERLLHNFNADTSTLLIIDEAQLISDDAVIEEIRLLLNFQLNDRFLINILLAGQPELRDRVDSFPQFEQRIFCRYHLHALDRQETESYINHRIAVAGSSARIFNSQALDLIFHHSQGIPRKINNICDLSLLFGASRNIDEIGADIINLVCR